MRPVPRRRLVTQDDDDVPMPESFRITLRKSRQPDDYIVIHRLADRIASAVHSPQNSQGLLSDLVQLEGHLLPETPEALFYAFRARLYAKKGDYDKSLVDLATATRLQKGRRNIVTIFRPGLFQPPLPPLPLYTLLSAVDRACKMRNRAKIRIALCAVEAQRIPYRTRLGYLLGAVTLHMLEKNLACALGAAVAIRNFVQRQYTLSFIFARFRHYEEAAEHLETAFLGRVEKRYAEEYLRFCRKLPDGETRLRQCCQKLRRREDRSEGSRLLRREEKRMARARKKKKSGGE